MFKFLCRGGLNDAVSKSHFNHAKFTRPVKPSLGLQNLCKIMRLNVLCCRVLNQAAC